jgi:hypothetical protein
MLPELPDASMDTRNPIGGLPQRFGPAAKPAEPLQTFRKIREATSNKFSKSSQTAIHPSIRKQPPIHWIVLAMLAGHNQTKTRWRAK